MGRTNGRLLYHACALDRWHSRRNDCDLVPYPNCSLQYAVESEGGKHPICRRI